MELLSENKSSSNSNKFEIFSTPLKPIYWGNEFSGTDRLSRHKLDILFTQSEVPAMAERDIFEDLPAETPVMLVFIQPK